MVLYLYKDKAQLGNLLPSPRLLRVDDEHFEGATLVDNEFGIKYML
jgi:hypothetical protein